MEKVLTHNWELGQDASLIFSENYSMNKIPNQIKKFKPSEYGGYMYWGTN